MDELIAAAPQASLGPAAATEFGALPYLFKVLAAAKPLSIQAHPTLEQAAAGFARENAAGLSLDAPERNYKDGNHKPEILCALTPFKALCGFRAPEAIAAALSSLDCPALAAPLAALALSDRSSALRNFHRALFALDEASRRALGETVRRTAPLSATDVAAWKIAGELAEEFPNDPAVLAPLYLNYLDLEPGEAIFLPAGILHAYVHGMGIELMANSDNVLRGGLTPKHVDIDELQAVLRFLPLKPEIIKPAPAGAGRAEYATPCREFRLHRLDGPVAALPAGTPYILIVVDGLAAAEDGGGASVSLRRGESLFVAADAPAPRLTGAFAAYAAGVGGR